MSDPHSHGSTPHGQQGGHSTTSDDMNLGMIIVVGLVSLALFAGGVVWAYVLLTGREGEIRAAGPARVPTAMGRGEFGIVDLVPFEIDRRLEVWQAANAKRLSSYGWVDRTKGIAHMPIERAMQQVVENPPDIAGEGVPPTPQKAAPVPAASQPTQAKPGSTPVSPPVSPSGGPPAGAPGSTPGSTR